MMTVIIMTIISIRIVVNVYNLLHSHNLFFFFPFFFYIFFVIFSFFFFFSFSRRGRRSRFYSRHSWIARPLKRIRISSLLFNNFFFSYFFLFFFLSLSSTHRPPSSLSSKNQIRSSNSSCIFFPSLSHVCISSSYLCTLIFSFSSLASHPIPRILFLIFISWFLLLSSKGFLIRRLLFLFLFFFFFFELPPNI